LATNVEWNRAALFFALHRASKSITLLFVTTLTASAHTAQPTVAHNVCRYHEPVADNAYLEDFYKDKLRYGFPLQVYLLNRRFQQHQQIIWTGKGGVQDRTIYEDTVFAKVTM
jgi:deoxyadenosine/deoxycytidine kinase